LNEKIISGTKISDDRVRNRVWYCGLGDIYDFHKGNRFKVELFILSVERVQGIIDIVRNTWVN
jgi:hypothetical protein